MANTVVCDGDVSLSARARVRARRAKDRIAGELMPPQIWTHEHRNPERGLNAEALPSCSNRPNMRPLEWGVDQSVNRQETFRVQYSSDLVFDQTIVLVAAIATL